MPAVTDGLAVFAETAETAQTIEPTILIAAPLQVVSDCMVYAIEREFPGHAVKRVWQQIPGLSEHQSVCIVLLDISLFSQVSCFQSKLNGLRSPVPMALLQNEGQSLPPLHEISASRMRGVIPMNLKLDVWLAAVRLLLVGGEYYPLSLFDSISDRRENRAVTPPALVFQDDDDLFDELTEREFQVLTQVANGMQNKMIAATLGLSEFTIKIHLHNINTKLGTHNRTAASALYHGRQHALRSPRSSLAKAQHAVVPLS